MPMLDFSRVLTNPTLIDSFSVIRRTEVVNDYGLSTVTPQTLSGLYGVVYPSNENDLKRFPDLEIQSKALTVITQFALRGESQCQGTEFQPDLVVWGGDNFLVRELEDWSRYGPGFILAICTSIDNVDQYAIPVGDGGLGVGDMGNMGFGE
jgi:hypothetical protein